MAAGLYQAQHDAALAQVKAKGAVALFTQPSAGGTYDNTSGFVSGAAPASVSGWAVRTKGNALRYQALSLLEAEAPTLFFVPDMYGQLPTLDMAIVWGGETYNVKHIDPVAPDGVAILARVIVAR